MEPMTQSAAVATSDELEASIGSGTSVIVPKHETPMQGTIETPKQEPKAELDQTRPKVIKPKAAGAASVQADDKGIFVSTHSTETEPTMRHWINRTGEYEIEGRLVWVRDAKVRILKANGRFATFDATELSADDFEYVKQL